MILAKIIYVGTDLCVHTEHKITFELKKLLKYKKLLNF